MLLKCEIHFSIHSFCWYVLPNSCTQIPRPLAYDVPYASPRKLARPLHCTCTLVSQHPRCHHCYPEFSPTKPIQNFMTTYTYKACSSTTCASDDTRGLHDWLQNSSFSPWHRTTRFTSSLSCSSRPLARTPTLITPFNAPARKIMKHRSSVPPSVLPSLKNKKSITKRNDEGEEEANTMHWPVVLAYSSEYRVVAWKKSIHSTCSKHAREMLQLCSRYTVRQKKGSMISLKIPWTEHAIL